MPLDHWIEPELRTLADPTGAGPRLPIAALVEGQPAPLLAALRGLEDRLAAEGVPRPAERGALFLELIHRGGRRSGRCMGWFDCVRV